MSKITFISTIDGLQDIEECRPQPAKNFIPNWFKDIPSSAPMTVKICPSFPDYFSQGYVLPMWADTKLHYNDDFGAKCEISPLVPPITTHSNTQFIDYVKPSFKDVDGRFVFKFNCPWIIITEPGWSVLQLPLFYHFNKEFSVLPGVIDTDIHHEVNQQVLYHSDQENIMIKRGDPLALYIPYKRNKTKLDYRFMTNKDEKMFNKKVFRLATKMTGEGYYRKLQRLRDKGV